MQIAEVAKRYGISVDTIRYYERIGLVPHVTRLPNGIRDFAEYDCGWVEFIRCMRESGVQIEALVEYVALFQEGEHTAAARLEILVEQREKLAAKLEEMREVLRDRRRMAAQGIAHAARSGTPQSSAPEG